MWVLKVRDSFSGAHFLRNYEGKCENLHGHNWLVEVEVEGDRLDEKTGILIDFKVIKGFLKDILEVLDHRLLNDLEAFRDVNPSAENIARFIYEEMKVRLSSYPNVRVRAVTVWESENSCATYLSTSTSSR